MAAKINDDTIRWYTREDYRERPEKSAAPSATLSAGAIVLNQEAAQYFKEDETVIIGTAGRGAKKILLRPAVSGDPYTPFRGKAAKNGLSIRCRSFVQDVLVGEYGMDLADKKRIKLEATLDEEHKRVVITIK